MHVPADPNPVDYTSPSQLPQSAWGGVSAVLGVLIVGFSLCIAFLHLAFAATDPAAMRLLLRIEFGMAGSLAMVGLVLALVGLLQRARRRSAAVFGLAVNGAILTVAIVGWLWA